MNYLVLGMARTGQAAAEWLKNKGHNVVTFDDNVGRADLSSVADVQWDKIHAIVQSPGVSFSFPKPHPITQKARDLSIPIVTDITLLNEANPKARYVGITGTNGKSTTTALVGHVLKSVGMKVEVGGNIGKAALELSELKEDGTYVLELSSYQLEMSKMLDLDVVGWVNIAPDHLDRHGTMENYVNAKSRIFEQAKCGVICIDDQYSKEICDKVSKRLPVMSVSGFGNVNANVVVRDDNLYDHQKFVAVLKDFTSLVGQHNFQNTVVAYGICKQLGVKIHDIIEAFKTFSGLEHRLEFVKTIRHVSFINDSKATNGEATLTALRALCSKKNIYLILGGKAKDDGIKPFKNFLTHVKKVYLIGDAADEFSKSLKNHPHEICGTLEVATQKAFAEADATDEKSIVLLSPACASFDQFKDFEERGNVFKSVVSDFS